MPFVNEHALCGCGSNQPAKHYDRYRREAICDGCVDARISETMPPTHPRFISRFQRIYTRQEIEKLRRSYPLEQRLTDLRREVM
jgi:hypothetical protein